MGKLVQDAQSLSIDKGVSIYTVTHFDINGFDLRSSNLANNFEGGVVLRNDKSNIKTTNAYVYSEDGKLEKPIIYSDFIGRLYHQNDNIETSNLNFITETGFTKFESTIRETNIRDNVNDFYRSIVPVDYDSYIFGEYNPHKIPETSNFGDEYSINGYVLHSNHGFIKDSNGGYANELMYYTRNVSEWTGNDGLSSENRYDYMGLVPSNLMETQGEADIITNHRDRNYTKEILKDIIEIAEYERDKYRMRNLRYDFDYFAEHRKFQDLSEGLGNRNYGDLERLMDASYSMSTLGKFGIYANSEDFRTANLEANANYSYKNTYAIGPESENEGELEYFSVNEKISDFISVVTKGNGGSTIDRYYREHDEGGSPTINVDEKYIKSFIPSVGESASGYSKLIQRTNSLFYNQKIGSLINRFHTSNVDLDNELITSKSSFGLSRGRNLLIKNAERNADSSTGYENPYCRVWTAHHQYGKLNTLIRPFKTKSSLSDTQDMYKETNLRPNNGAVTLGNHSVLMDNGFVRITPMHGKTKTNEDIKNDVKKCMFSIENLAWRDIRIENELSNEQQGPNGGRIMWFPPYNLKFTENVNVDWNANKFIGRGEQIYTYTNTDRSGTLSFTLLIDHPSIINKWRGRNEEVDKPDERENEILRFFAGCEPLEGTCGNGIDTPNENPNPDKTPNNPTYQGRTKKVALVLFFPNNFSGFDYETDVAINSLKTYEKGTSGTEWVNEEDSDIPNQVYENHNKSLFNLNYAPSNDVKSQIKRTLFNNDETVDIYSFFDTTNGYDHLNEVIQNTESSGGTIFGEIGTNIKIDVIEAKGFASSHGFANNNVKLGNRRRDLIKKATNENCSNITLQQFNDLPPKEIPMNDVGTENRDINSLEAKIARCSYVLFRIKWDEETTTNSEPSERGTRIVSEQNFDNVQSGNSGTAVNMSEAVLTTTQADEYSCGNEYLYFAELADTKDVAYEKIIEKIRYFNPAFHSITPEGFNSRLTFLQQCTRQGPTLDLSSGAHDATSPNYVKYAGNLSFGRAPYCILRIGDFFHTKICITSMSIDYANDSSIQWDLNPEGAGVQPMFANININFNFIGGQDITGPVERLQNAVSSNYYANASIYDKKANKNYSPGLKR